MNMRSVPIHADADDLPRTSASTLLLTLTFFCLLLLTTNVDAAAPPMTASSSSHSHAHTNRLAREKSPYLLQHQHNPVDWYPWGPEAFEKAVRENKPIFLSIGYSTCHWCHVMERESFESETVAALLNEFFVPIKVDREERPDVDKIYMTFVQAMTGGGGWPLNVFLAPDRKPFFGGTYWAPEPKHGRPSFPDVLKQVREVWKTKRERITESTVELHQQLAGIMTRQTNDAAVLTLRDVHHANGELQEGYDSVHGGFGRAPKFPTPSVPRFLLASGVQFGDSNAIQKVLHTCQKMAAGGIYDQLGGGFARYSVDEKWLVPHFEKMLYDNAQLVELYLEAHLVSREGRYADVARDVLRYVLRDMTHSEGGFYSAEDADSEGKEGKFYCWTLQDVKQLLTAEQLAVVVRYFGITAEGNFLDHSDPDPLKGQNVLSQVDPALTVAEAKLLQEAKDKMFEVRSRRVRPHLDDKVLASWNGLMLSAVARAYAVLGDEKYRAAAEKNLAFLKAQLWDANKRELYHRWRLGERDSVQLLEGYAFLCQGVVDLYEATLNPDYLDYALELAESMMQKFYDPAEGGFWHGTKDATDLILRVKDDYDGAEPSGNAVATITLLRLAAIADRKDFREAAEKTLKLFSERLQKQPHAVPFLLRALQFSQEEPRRVVIAGDPKLDSTRALVRAAHGVFQPVRVILGNRGRVEPFARTLQEMGGAPAAYVCLGTACKAPVKKASEVTEILREK